jgi:hypothetical protein
MLSPRSCGPLSRGTMPRCDRCLCRHRGQRSAGHSEIAAKLLTDLAANFHVFSEEALILNPRVGLIRLLNKWLIL